jgi:hypothetical protein
MRSASAEVDTVVRGTESRRVAGRDEVDSGEIRRRPFPEVGTGGHAGRNFGLLCHVLDFMLNRVHSASLFFPLRDYLCQLTPFRGKV